MSIEPNFMGWHWPNDGFRAECAKKIRQQGTRGGDRYGVLGRLADFIAALPINDPRLILLNRVQSDSDHYEPGQTTMTFLARVGVDPTSTPLEGSEAFHFLLACAVSDRIGSERVAAKSRDEFSAQSQRFTEEINSLRAEVEQAEALAAARAQDNSDLRGQLKAAKAELEELTVNA